LQKNTVNNAQYMSFHKINYIQNYLNTLMRKSKTKLMQLFYLMQEMALLIMSLTILKILNEYKLWVKYLLIIDKKFYKKFF